MIKPWYNFFLTISFLTENPQFNPHVFPIILVYIINKIYPGNLHFILYQLVQKIK